MDHTEIVETEGHLVDSLILQKIFDRVIETGAAFEVIHFELGRTNEEMSRLRLKITAPDAEVMRRALDDLVELGCAAVDPGDALLRPAENDGVVPDDFYSTTNHRTSVRIAGEWAPVESQRMDAVIVIGGGKACCRKLRDVKKGEPIVCGPEGVRIQPQYRPRNRQGFTFMGSENSSERRTETAARKAAEKMKEIRGAGGRIVFVAGPVVVHTGGARYFVDIIRMGYVDALLAGNALAVHDVEHALHGTSLGLDLESGVALEEGHKNHMRAINTVSRHGGLRGAVEAGVVKSGIMYECVKPGVPFSLAGSIRDDGPLPDTEMDLVRAQADYARLLEGAHMVVCLSSMLHSIGVGNMLPAWVYVVCVDINPAVVTKLSDRGSQQTIGVVTEVGTFLHLLAAELRSG